MKMITFVKNGFIVVSTLFSAISQATEEPTRYIPEEIICEDSVFGCPPEPPKVSFVDIKEEIRLLDEEYSKYLMSDKGHHYALVDKNKKGIIPEVFDIEGKKVQALLFKKGSCFAVHTGTDYNSLDLGYADYFSVNVAPARALSDFLNDRESSGQKPYYRKGCDTSKKMYTPSENTGYEIDVDLDTDGTNEILFLEDVYLSLEIFVSKSYKDNHLFISGFIK